MISLSVAWVRRIIRAIGIANLFFAAVGGSFAAIVVALGGVHNSPDTPYLRQAYFIFVFVDACCLVALVVGTSYLLRLNRLGLRICNWVFAGEIVRFLGSVWISLALVMSWRWKPLGLSIGAAEGVGSAAITPQIITGYPVLALIVLNLSRRGFSNGAIHTRTESTVDAPHRIEVLRDENHRRRKRPGLVWIISIFNAFSFLFAVLILYLVASNSIPLSPEVKNSMQRLTAFDYALSGVQALLGISAAIALFMMRKVAYQLYSASLVVGAFALLWQVSARGSIPALRSIKGEPIGDPIGLGLLLAVLLYTRSLKSRGILV